MSNLPEPTELGKEIIYLFEKLTGRKPYRKYTLDEKLEYYNKRFYDLSLPSSKRSYAKKRYLELEKIKFGKKDGRFL